MKRAYAVALLVAAVATFSVAQSAGNKPFELMKSLTGNWQGKTTEGGQVNVSFKDTAGGSAIMSEIQSEMQGKSETMVSMINMDGSRLLLTHYCAAGNQPRMQAAVAPDGKSVTFSFVDATNLANADDGHMDHVVFKFTDADHHTEEWHFLAHGKEMVETFNLERKS